MTQQENNTNDIEKTVSPWWINGNFCAVLTESFDTVNVINDKTHIFTPARTGLYRFTNKRERNRFVSRANASTIDRIAFII